jgi:hypothetical protein
MPHANLVIVWVMRRRDLHCSCPKIHVDCDGVGHNRQPAVDKRVKNEFPMEML